MEWERSQAERVDELQRQQLEMEQERLRLQVKKEGERKLDRVVNELPKLRDSDEISVYLTRFESAMKAAETEEDRWNEKLRNLLTGNALAVWVDLMSVEEKRGYYDLKDDFLDQLGYDWHSCAAVLCTTRKTHTESWDSLFRSFTFKYERLLNGCNTLGEAIKKLAQPLIGMNESQCGTTP